MMVLAMQFVCWLMSRIHGWGHIIPFDMGRVLRTAFGAWLGFFAIGLVLWGIYTGKFSPTEAAAVTVGFCVIVGVLSRWLFPLVASGMDEHGRPRTYAASILAPLIGISVVMQQILSLLGAQEAIGQWVSGL